MDPQLFLGYDVGTGGTKSVLIDGDGRVLATSFCAYPIYYPRPHWAEQEPEDLWQAIITCTREVLTKAAVNPHDIAALGFSAQMLLLIPLRADGTPVGRAVSWLDSRGDAQAARIIRTLGGKKVIQMVAGAIPTGKDVIAKMLWFRDERPDDWKEIDKFLDGTGYLVYKATGRKVLDHTGAGGTGLISNGSRQWSRALLALVRMPKRKLAEIVSSIAVVGPLNPEAAQALGLPAGVPVIAGMSDIPAAATGSGALRHGEGHIYLGTSSWLCVSAKRPKGLGKVGIASVPSPDPEMFVMIGESETAGACVDWFVKELAPLEVQCSREEGCSVYAILDDRIADVEPGARNLVFAPWMFGERSPVADTSLHGAFINLALEHTRADMLRAVYEGVAYNIRWLLEAVAKAGFPLPELRAIGGGAQSDVWMQIMADVTGRRIEAVADPQSAGAVGCALAAQVALGLLPDYVSIRDKVRVRRTFEPRPEMRERYDRLFRVFQETYPALSRAGKLLNR
ncbi:MAG: xylulokinase [Candidatus Geothermincolia bacterium]